jgi:hypothetical protein
MCREYIFDVLQVLQTIGRRLRCLQGCRVVMRLDACKAVLRIQGCRVISKIGLTEIYI